MKLCTMINNDRIIFTQPKGVDIRKAADTTNMTISRFILVAVREYCQRHNVKNLLTLRQQLINIGLVDFINKYKSLDGIITYNKDNADVIELANKAREHSAKLDSIEIIKISKKKKNGVYVQQHISIVNSLLRFVGIKTKKKQVMTTLISCRILIKTKH